MIRLKVAELANSGVEDIVAGIFLQLNDILSRNTISSPGRDNWSKLGESLSGRSCQSGDKKSQKDGKEVHLGALGLEGRDEIRCFPLVLGLDIIAGGSRDILSRIVSARHSQSNTAYAAALCYTMT